MTAVIKSDDRAGGQRVAELKRRSKSAHPAEIECARLQREVDALRAELTQLRRAHGDALREAEARTEHRVREEQRKDRERADAAIEDACISAQTRFGEALQDLTDQAPVLAVEALRPLLLEPDQYEGLVIQAVQRQLAMLGETAVIEVIVSAQDFGAEPTNSIVDMIQGPANLKLSISPTAGAGEVRLRLKLGEMELSLKDYWRRVRQAMETAIAEPDAS